AQALRYGDLRTAAEAVPGVLGSATSPIPVVDDATRILGETTPGGRRTAMTTTSRSPWTWPLIALITLLIVVLLGPIIALLVQPTGTEPPEEPGTSEPPTEEPTVPVDPTVLVDPAEFRGLTFAQAEAKLHSLNLEVVGPI